MISSAAGPARLSCGGPPPGSDDDDGLGGELIMSLESSRAAATQLAARFRIYAAGGQEPAAFAGAAAITAAAQVLGQAWILAGGSTPGVASQPTAADAPGAEELLGPAGRREETAQLLAGTLLLSRAVSRLSARTAPAMWGASSPPPGCLAGVHACLHTAEHHLSRTVRASVSVWEPVPLPDEAAAPGEGSGPW
jgi:hypothetical protein